MGRSPCCDKVGLKKGPWTPEEDQKLLAYIQEHGHGSWRALPPKAGLQRCGKSCRLRWTNYLRPDIKRGKFSLQEEQTIIQLHALLGNRWSAIASHLPKRTDNEIKNYWNTHLKKRLTKMGIDPVTHKPKNHALIGGGGQSKDMANLSHMAQWESARLEAEARIVRESSKFVMAAADNNNRNHHTLAALTQPRPPFLDILRVWQGVMTSTKHHRKDITTSNHMIMSNNTGNLESPTSILSLSEHMLGCPLPVSLMMNQHAGSSYMGSLSPVGAVEVQEHEDQMNGTYNNSSFMEGFGDLQLPLPPSGPPSADYEDSKNSYWTDILNVVNSPMDALGVL